MKFRISIILTVICVLLPLAYQSARAETLTVQTYVELTIARMQLARDSWQANGRSPTAEEMDVLWQQYSTTEEDYLMFPGKQRAAVNDYLAANPESQTTIEQLRASIEALIEQAE
ncbi:hypothetical protein [Marinobacterium aestuariivivens]|uniref:Uncharacterized protein n=1 Tax=Marinobacterium aestuariivivens TaxID=1698799 RepID=A0ABW2A1U7_9GAMM